MISAKEIQATCDDIVREFAPMQVILFGSYAYGAPTEESDVDMFVVMDVTEPERRDKTREIRERIPHRFPMDIIVRSPADIAYRVAHNDWFLREILEKGQVLYDTMGALPTLSIAENALVPVWEEKGTLNPLTLESVTKAETDWLVLKLTQEPPNLKLKDHACFYAQQCIAAYLTAWLQEANLRVPRTRVVQELLTAIVPVRPAWTVWQTDCSIFPENAMDYLYPGK